MDGKAIGNRKHDDYEDNTMEIPLPNIYELQAPEQDVNPEIGFGIEEDLNIEGETVLFGPERPIEITPFRELNVTLDEEDKIKQYLQELRGLAQTPETSTTEDHQLSVSIENFDAQKPDNTGDIGDSATWSEEFRKYMRKKEQGRVEKVYKEAMKTPGFERHVFISDFQIPDHDPKTIRAVNKFIKDFAPDKLHILGDFLNFTRVAKYDQDPYYHKNMADEIKEGRKILKQLVALTRDANPESQIMWYEGNHEARLTKYLGRNASALAEITDENGEIINSIPHMFNLKDLGVQWIPAMQRQTEKGGIEVEHGDIARSKGGNTAHGMLERRGKSGFSGHTHRLAMVMKTQTDEQKFWIETGSMCKQDFESPYTRSPDWQQGFAVGIYSEQDKRFYPTPVPVFDNKFAFGGKIYKP